MGVILTVGRQKAFLREGEWRSADRGLEQRLNHLTSEWIVSTGGPSLDSQDPELDVAIEISRSTGGRVVLQSRSDQRRTARIYFARRQYKLAFF